MKWICFVVSFVGLIGVVIRSNKTFFLVAVLRIIRV